MFCTLYFVWKANRHYGLYDFSSTRSVVHLPMQLSSMDTDQEVPGSIPGVFQIFWEAASLERGPLSLVRTTEELLEGNVAAPV
jgi:hypothetical protein